MLDRTLAPPSNQIQRPKFPVTDELFINDIPVVLLNQGNQPVTLFELVIPVGRWHEPKPGLSYFLFKMITEGTKNKSASEIASTFDFYGSHLEVTPTLDNVSIKLYSLNKFLPKVLPLLISLLSESIFPEREFVTLKQIRSQQIKQQLARNNVYASMKFREMLFGENHPYGFMLSPEAVDDISLDDVVSFEDALLVRPRIFISGQIDELVLTAVSQALEDASFGKVLASSTHDLSASNRQTIVREDSTQASIRIGKLAIDKHHDDIHQLKITNTLLGGYFGSRLMKNIREEKGLTYGIHASIINLEKFSYWAISSEIQKSKIELAKTEILKEVERLANNEPGEKEMLMLKNYTRGKFLSSFDSPFSSHEMIKGLLLANLDTIYLQNFLDSLDRIQPNDISEMTKKHLVEGLSELVVY